MPIQANTSIGRYQITALIGRGGMAEVYRALDTRLDTEVAIKFIRVDEFPPSVLRSVVKRFRSEAKSMAQLSHPNIVKVSDFGTFEGIPYLVMDHLPGGTFKQYLGKPVPYQQAARMLLPIAKALAFAHANGVVHRDVKPANILIGRSGDPLLSDFGVAKLIDREETHGLTATGASIGTPAYMAPEQAMGKKIDQRVDVYSLGVIFYELVTGRRPFTADTPMQVIVKQSSEALPPPSRYVKGLPDAVEQALQTALDKDPRQRFGDMNAFVDVLEQLASGVKSAKRTSVKKPIPPKNAVKRPAKPKTKRVKVADSRTPLWGRWYFWAGIGLTVVALVTMGVPSLAEMFTSTQTPIPILTSVPTQTQIPKLGIGSTTVSEKDDMTMVFVPAGEFEMGSKHGYEDESPVHTVYLGAFWVDQTEVTNNMFAEFLNSEGNQKEDGKNWLDAGDVDTRISNLDDIWQSDHVYADHPVVEISWYGANAYCAWVGRRLPTEAEWEKAARGDDGRTYPWGEEISCSRANYSGCDQFPRTSPVGYYGEMGASLYGADDMAGNVWEWVADWYEGNYYAEAPYRNPTGPDSGDYRVIRGGSWINNEGNARSANRNNFNPTDSYNNVGFRCALSP